jgi:hydrogenase maturation protease
LDLRRDLAGSIKGRTCILGIGNRCWGDDAFGVVLAESLQEAGYPDVVVAETAPESFIGRLKQGNYETVLMLDAVEFTGDPGSVVFLDAASLRSRFPQLSTHKLSLGTLAALIQDQVSAKVWCLGAKPLTLAPGGSLSPPLAEVTEVLKELLLGLLPRSVRKD